MQIKLEKINKSFDQRVILKNFNLEIEKADFVVITGKSGHGKTTLLNIIGMLEKPNSGNLIINDVKNPDINQKSGRNLVRNDVGYLFQNYGLVDNKTVLENLLLPLKLEKNSVNKNNILIREALKEVGLSGYEKRKIYSLSGGEQQRVSIARLIIKNANIILADEPTSSLDGENEIQVMNLLKSLNESGKTIIMVTHNPELRNYATKLINI